MNQPLEDWKERVERHFGAAQSEGRRARWDQHRHRFSLGDLVAGVVTAKAPFGLWLELASGVPGLLLVPYIDAEIPENFEEGSVFPVGDTLRGCVVSFNDRDQVIGLRQVEPIFAEVSPAEHARLTEWVAPCRSIDDVIEKLGPPDEDWQRGAFVAAEGSGRWRRTVTYRNLSEAATLKVLDMAPEPLKVDLSAKYLGKRSLL